MYDCVERRVLFYRVPKNFVSSGPAMRGPAFYTPYDMIVRQDVEILENGWERTGDPQLVSQYIEDHWVDTKKDTTVSVELLRGLEPLPPEESIIWRFRAR